VRRFAPQVFAQIFCITVLAFCVPESQAQRPNQDIQNRSWSLSNIRRDVDVERPNGQLRLAQVELKNDYRKLQVVNNDLMKRVFKPSGNQTITPKEIRSSLGEIKKLAERLRSNFGLPEEEGDEPANDVALKPGLLELDKTIMSFIDNPLLREPRVYDTELASQAAKDLNAVSRLADALRRLTKQK
jgi:hypothetical protein